MSGLTGKRVALLEGRMSPEMAALVQRQGGEPYSVPAVRETPLPAGYEVGEFIDALEAGSITTVIFLTGAGARALFKEADELGRLPALLAVLRSVTTVCRGPKPSAALARQDVPIRFAALEPFTTVEILVAIESLDLHDTGVGLVHYGERDGQLADTLRQRGALLTELCLYEWQLPEDLRQLQTLVRAIGAGSIDAIAFTSQVQVKHLFQVAGSMHLERELVDGLNTKTVVASLAPTCASALRSQGVTPHVIPEHSKMGHLISALAHHMEQCGR